MDWSMVLVASAGLFLAGIIKGATGLGYASCALPFLVMAIGLKPAMALVMIPAMATNVSLAFTTGHFEETLRRFKWLYAAMLPGIVVGLGLLLWISQAVAVKTLGTLIIVYVLFTLLRPQMSLSPLLERRLLIPTGFFNGVLTGLTGSQVMPLFPYMMSLGLDSNRMVQAINLAVMIASAFLSIGLIVAGIMTWPLLGLSVVAIVPALMGVTLGTKVREAIPVAWFRMLVLGVLFVIGITMIAR